LLPFACLGLTSQPAHSAKVRISATWNWRFACKGLFGAYYLSLTGEIILDPSHGRMRRRPPHRRDCQDYDVFEISTYTPP
jgi:hypothetical protein